MRASGVIIFVATLLLYMRTAAPGITFIDSGELAAVATLLGIAHPTGYPLFTLIGRLVTAVPGPLEPIVRLTFLSGFCISLGLVVFNATLIRVLATTGIANGSAQLAALGSTLTLAGAATLWSQAVVVEVYALGFLFLTLLLWLALRAAERGSGHELLYAYVAGLAVANHGSAAPLVPALALPLLIRWRLGHWRAAAVALLGGMAILALPVNRVAGLLLTAGTLTVLLQSGAGRAAWRRLLAMTTAAIAGLTIYLYLPVRSAVNPILDWGDPESLPRFIRHITGKVYHVWFLSSWETMQTQLGQFGRQLSSEMTPLALVPMAIGAVLLWRRNRVLAQLTLLVMVLNLLYASNYDIHDIATYFLPTITITALWIAVALGAAISWCRQDHRGAATWRRAAALALALLLPVTTLAVNYGAADQHRNHLVADYTTAMFASLEPNAVLLSRQWDNFCAAALYEQLVRGRRPDVTIVEKELLRRSWYPGLLERRDAELLLPCREAVAVLQAALVPFETDGEFDANHLQRSYHDLIHCLLESGENAGRPIYLTPDARTNEPGLTQQYLDVPVGLAMRLYHTLPESVPAAIIPEVRAVEAAAVSADKMSAQLAALVLEMITRRAIFEAGRGNEDAARQLLLQALAIHPGYQNAQVVLQRLENLPDRETLETPRR